MGTFPLPESQLDRFLMRIKLGYPDYQAERRLLAGEDPRRSLEKLKPVMDEEILSDLQQRVHQIHISDALLDYVQALLNFSRESPHYLTGLSPRAGLALVHAARAWAMIHHRNHVLPEDIQECLPYVAAHRLQPSNEMRSNNQDELMAPLEEVAIP